MRIFICFLFFIFSYTSYTQDCNIGNSDNIGFDGSGNFIADNLLGIKFSLNEDGVLRRVNLLGQETGALVQMAVYDDSNGVPNNLVAFTEVHTVEDGLNSFPVDPVQLLQGDYWVMAIYDSDGLHTFKEEGFQNPNAVKIFFTPMDFGEPIPENAQDFSDYTSGSITYFLEIDCGLVAIDEQEFSSQTLIYPNPSSDFINILNLKTGESFVDVYNATFKKVISKQVEAGMTTVDISYLVNGIYYYRINNGSMKILVKQ